MLSSLQAADVSATDPRAEEECSRPDITINYCEAQYYYTYIIKSCTQHNIHRRQQQWGREIRDSSGPTFLFADNQNHQFG
jgi:hypothetical protein